jgi:glycosyltransferase A (GT-A) superfamily protein (DUF2064 family)
MSDMDALIVLVKNPITMDELPPALRLFTEAQMLELKTAFVEDTICICAQLQGIDLKVAVAPTEHVQMVTRAVENLQKRFPRRKVFANLFDRLEILTQKPIPLNGRMRDSIAHCFEAGYHRVLTVGGHNPTITKKLLATASRELRRQKVILGPTIRGSFYLVGTDENRPQLFDDVPVGTDHAYRAICERLRESGLQWKELDLWYDISHQEDIEFIIRDINHFRLTGDEESARATEEVLAKYLAPEAEEAPPKKEG